jgi:hypothetical protein
LQNLFDCSRAGIASTAHGRRQMPNRNSVQQSIRVITQCPRCSDSVLSVFSPRQWDLIQRFDGDLYCDKCKYKGWFGFLYTPIGLLAQAMGAVCGLAEGIRKRLVRRGSS